MRGSRILIAVIAALALAGCSTTGGSGLMVNAYTAKADGAYKLPAIPVSKIKRQYRRQIVAYQTKEKPGTVIVDTKAKYLYFVLDGGKAVRYGIGVGREGFTWSGTARVAFKREWPTWTPPEPMIKRQPELAKYRGGMKPGLTNPLGARALYLYNRNGDTGYRLHGTPEWWSIGGNVSSGCIRLMNQDIIDLYERVEPGAKVIVT
ncbi:L,D-transpeptidase [Oricola thermophila]|uniref:L,D-transpeptidase n=1 Tax=Oricola thermophila TaxID=2742145 RepID=A0A6N1VF72_9HYPH|nr:L,D-transpeptidase [Oricola thermophila]QKV19571.1 L,D-transpeptidase [Oricola thermophila]